MRQALTVKAKNISVIEAFEIKTSKTADAVKLLNKLGAVRRTLLVVEDKTTAINRTTRNIPNLIVTQAKYLNVYDLLNADSIIITNKSVDIITEWLGISKVSEDKK